MTTPTPPIAPLGTIKSIAIEHLRESPDNPRKHFDPLALEDLAQSLRVSGLLNELKVRPRPDGSFEIGAGHRRFRAAKLAGLVALPCIVKDMDDRAFLELLIIENDQREDVHPLEEAAGYKVLITRFNLDARAIADRVGRSTDYVWDRLNLLNLVPMAQQIFLEKRILLEHAKILSRLTHEQQLKAIDPKGATQYGMARSGLWCHEHSDAKQGELDGTKRSPYDGLKAVTPAELKAWVNDHCRLEVEEPELLEAEFPETAANLVAAAEVNELAAAEGEKKPAVKVVPITHDHQVSPYARDENGERTYGNRSWKRADEKPCEHAALGVVVAGAGRGDSFDVCVAKDKCKTHWAKEIKEREAVARISSRRGAVAGKQAQESYLAKEKASREMKEREQKAIAERLKRARTPIELVVRNTVGAAPLKTIFAVVLDAIDYGVYDRKGLLAKTQANEFLYELVEQLTLTALREYRGYEWELNQITESLEPFKLDFRKLLEEHAPVEPKAAPVKREKVPA